VPRRLQPGGRRSLYIHPDNDNARFFTDILPGQNAPLALPPQEA
jgi:hypothetical protein